MSEAVRATVKAPETKKELQVSHVQKGNFYQPVSSPVEQILFLQRTIGNQSVQKLMKSGAMQAKLRIGSPDDIYEQEADRVAEQVMRMPEPQVSESDAASVRRQGDLIQRKCPGCAGKPRSQHTKEDKEMKLHAKEVTGQNPEIKPETEANINSIRGGGQPLPESVRAFYEPRFGRDFSGVWVHTDENAAKTAKAVNAQAFTVGQDVVFGQGLYAPGTSAGQRLLAHELTHVVQQGAGSVKVSPLNLNRQKASDAQRGQKKPAGAGKVKYIQHLSFKKQKLTKDNIERAIGYLLATPAGKEAVDNLENRSVVVYVFFVGDNKDVPASGEPAGYFEEVGPDLFNVYVVAGQRTTILVPVGRGVTELQESIVDRDPRSISDSLFHELLHVWFVKKFQGKGTGHTKEVKPTEVDLEGIKTYDEDEYDPVFLEKLKKFDRELKELKKKIEIAPEKKTPAQGTIQPKLIISRENWRCTVVGSMIFYCFY